MRPLFLLPLLAALPLIHAAESPKPELPGMRADGSVLLPNQWALRPAGKQVRAGDFPVNIAMHPSGGWMAVLHAGYGPHEVVVLDTKTGATISRVEIDETFYGLAFADGGRRLLASGSGAEVLHSFAFSDGFLSEKKMIALRDPKQRGIPSGIAVAADGTAYVCNLWAHTVSRVRRGEGEPVIDEVKLTASAGQAVPLPADTSTDDPSITKRDRALLDATGATEPFPYACVLDEKKAMKERGQENIFAFCQKSTYSLICRGGKLQDYSPDPFPASFFRAPDGVAVFDAHGENVLADETGIAPIDLFVVRAGEDLLAFLETPAAKGKGSGEYFRILPKEHLEFNLQRGKIAGLFS